MIRFMYATVWPSMAMANADCYSAFCKRLKSKRMVSFLSFSHLAKCGANTKGFALSPWHRRLQSPSGSQWNRHSLASANVGGFVATPYAPL